MKFNSIRYSSNIQIGQHSSCRVLSTWDIKKLMLHHMTAPTGVYADSHSSLRTGTLTD